MPHFVAITIFSRMPGVDFSTSPKTFSAIESA
jgi:hypothetical protein